MNIEDLAFVKRRYSILALVREGQEMLGYTYGLVQPDLEVDQKTRCPCHNEEQPSAKAYVESNSVYCWVCGRTWDVPELFKVIHNVSLPVAVEQLMNRLGLEVADRTASRAERDKALATLDGSLDLQARVDAWCRDVFLWVASHGGTPRGGWPVLDYVEDALSARGGMLPLDQMRFVRNAMAVVFANYPAIPPCPAESPLRLMLMSLPLPGEEALHPLDGGAKTPL